MLSWAFFSMGDYNTPHTIRVDYFTNFNAEGVCIKYPIGYNVAATYSEIQINLYYSDYPKSVEYRRSVIAHEIGHLLWLKDDPPTFPFNNSLMHNFADPETIYFPQPYDVNNVRFRYD